MIFAGWRRVCFRFIFACMADSIHGRGAAGNPQNRFERLAYLEDPDFVQPDPEAEAPPAPRTRFYRDPSRSVIMNALNMPESWSLDGVPNFSTRVAQMQIIRI